MSSRILIVDDQAIVLDVVQDILTDSGYEVQCSATVSEAVSVVEEFLPDLVLLDIVMPEPDGLRLLEVLDAQYPDVSTIILTGGKDMDKTELALEMGAKEYIMKPFDADELIEAVERWTE